MKGFLVFGAVLAVVPAAPSCGPFEFEFPAQGGAPSLGGSGGTGGTSSGGGGTFGEGGGFGTPCIALGTCEDECGAGDNCNACTSSEDCKAERPYCDLVMGTCVECLDGEQCVERFGTLFPACSAGKCVQCQTNDDCSMGAVCKRGWCGVCFAKEDCAEGFECVDMHCQPTL